MIIESSGKDEKGKFGIGKGLAVRKATNYFGIKADKNWKGKKIQLSTPRDGKPVSLFRVYNAPLDSLKDHTEFLLKNSRYKSNGVFTAKTPKAQTEALQRAAYSESPTYGKTLIGIINAYRLTELDGKKKTENFTPWFVAAGASILIAGIYSYREQIKDQFTSKSLAA